MLDAGSSVFPSFLVPKTQKNFGFGDIHHVIISSRDRNCVGNFPRVLRVKGPVRFLNSPSESNQLQTINIHRRSHNWLGSIPHRRLWIRINLPAKISTILHEVAGDSRRPRAKLSRFLLANLVESRDIYVESTLIHHFFLLFFDWCANDLLTKKSRKMTDNFSDCGVKACTKVKRNGEGEERGPRS